MNIFDYRLISKNDYNSFILLHNKHKVKDFQKAIDTARDIECENIRKFGDDWQYIIKHLNEFDYIELSYCNESISF